MYFSLQLSFSLSFRLTPENCPVLTDRNLFESFPWFEMMLKLQKITRDLKGASVFI